MKWSRYIVEMLLWVLVIGISSETYATEYTGTGLKSPAAFSGINAMPPQLKEFFLTLSPVDVNAACPLFIRRNNIAIMVPREDETGNDWIKVGGYVTAITDYAVQAMDVLYRTPFTPGFSYPYHELTIEYLVTAGRGYERRFMKLEIKFWDRDKINDKSHHDYADWFSSLSDPGESKRIKNVPVSFGKDNFCVPAKIASGTNEIIWNKYDLIKEIHFSCGPFVIDMTTTMPYSVGGSTRYLSNPYWVENTWPRELKMLSLDASAVRLIEPFAERMIDTLLKNRPPARIEPAVPSKTRGSRFLSLR